MMNCAFCKKKMLIKFIMTCFNITAADIARDLNVSASLVRKHIDGDRECKSVDLYIIHRCFDVPLEVENAAK